MKQLVSLASFSLCLALLTGCGDGRPALVPVTGTVTLNGDPVEGAQVGFEPQDMGDYSRPSIAVTDQQGQFTVGTYGISDGMPVGMYKVSVFKKEAVGKLPENYNSEDTESNPEPVRYQWTVPQIYSTTAESGLTVEVTADGMTPDTLALTGEAEMEESAGGANEP
ncbi:MAG: hypothetical protein KDA89_18540 [Planctomycetaceae bacterium]|nr:hypothetical protein [Planctomycetaceae bacterium]